MMNTDLTKNYFSKLRYKQIYFKKDIKGKNFSSKLIRILYDYPHLTFIKLAKFIQEIINNNKFIKSDEILEVLEYKLKLGIY